MNELTQSRLPYLIIFNIALIASFAVLALSWRNREGKGVKAFIISVLLETSWLIGYMLELSVSNLDQKLFWDNMQYIGALFAPVTLLIFSLQFTNRKFNLKRWLIILLTISTLFQLIIFVDLAPELIHANPAIEAGLPWDELTYDFGTITLLANAYAQILALAYIIILVSGFFKQNVQRTQLAIVTIGTALPTIGVILALTFGLKFANQRDVSPLMFVLSNIIIAWGIFQKRLFNVAPIAREILFEKMNNILIILDKDDRVIDLNLAGRETFGGNSKEDLLGTHISLLQPALYQEFGKILEFHTELTDEEGRTFNFNITPLYDNRGLLMGRLVNANDITEQKEVEKRLQEISSQNELRAMRLNAISDISQAISQIRNLRTLLPLVARRISKEFDFYHVGIFLFSSDGRYAELIASNSEGGKRMLKRGHRLEIGQVGVVGKVAQDGTPRVALDVGQDAVYFDNPDLPETHSEMALPLKLGSETFGVLDVQSKRKNVFSEEDAEVFISLANQVAIAIDNARQVEATNTALEEARSLTQEYVREAWTRLAAQKSQLGYRFANNSVFPYSKKDDPALAKNTEMKVMEFPVQLREETIGVIKVRMLKDEADNLTENDKTLLNAVGERAGLALESARLLEDTAQRAGKESAISQFSATISNISQTDKLMSVAVSELQKILEAAEVSFELKEDL